MVSYEDRRDDDRNHHPVWSGPRRGIQSAGRIQEPTATILIPPRRGLSRFLLSDTVRLIPWTRRPSGRCPCVMCRHFDTYRSACSVVAGSVRPDATCNHWRTVEDEAAERRGFE